MFKTIILIFAITLSFASCTEPRKDSIDLSGTWHYKLDPDSIGEAQSWFSTRFDQEMNNQKLHVTLLDGETVLHQTI